MTRRRKRIKREKTSPKEARGTRFGDIINWKNGLGIKVALTLVVGSLIAYAFIGGGPFSKDKKSGINPSMKAPSILSNLPSYAYDNQKTLEGYTRAIQISHILEWIPCYCGCYSHDRHRNAKNCFLRDDGGYDEHGSQCEMCLDIAISSYNWYIQGTPLAEIRSRIGRAFSEYGTPTPTTEIPEILVDLTVDKDPAFTSPP